MTCRRSCTARTCSRWAASTPPTSSRARRYLAAHAPDLPRGAAEGLLADIAGLKAQATEAFSGPVPARPPNFCTGCPERPVFAALKLVEQDIGKLHVSADIGCHSFATFAPFSFGNSILGYGMSLASSAGVRNFSASVAVMGDGGFWHNGLLSGVSSALLKKGDGVLVIMKNGYTSATGTQETISTPTSESRRVAEGTSATGSEVTIENTLSMGVKLRTVDNYKVGDAQDARGGADLVRGPLVVIADGECQLKPAPYLPRAKMLKRQARRAPAGVDEDTCTGDHSCIRLGLPHVDGEDATTRRSIRSRT